MYWAMMKLVHILFHSVFVLVSIFFAYYWYKIRPDDIRAECQKMMAEQQRMGSSARNVNDPNSQYEFCVSELGLK